MPRGRWIRAGALGLSISLATISCADPRHFRDALRAARDPERPRPMAEVGRDVDAAEMALLAGGTIVVKQPDVWGQDRMTTFRRDVENQLKAELDRFRLILAARRATSERTAIEANASVAGVVVPRGKRQAVAVSTSSAQAASDPSDDRDKQAAIADAGLTAADPSASGAPSPISLKDRFAGLGQADGSLGLEPQVYLDEKIRYLDHLNELRRINLGDDVSDSAGYGLYLVRMPVSIQPGSLTKEGWGALLTATVRPEFSPDFLASTYRNLVINDLVDQLAPVVAQLIHGGDWQEPLAAYEESYREFEARAKPSDEKESLKARGRLIEAVGKLRLTRTAEGRAGKNSYPVAMSDLDRVFLVENLCRIARDAEAQLKTQDFGGKSIRSHLRHELEAAYDVMRGHPESPGPLANPSLIEHFADQVQTRRFECKPGEGPPIFQGTGVEPNELADSYRVLAASLPGNLKQRSLGRSAGPSPSTPACSTASFATISSGSTARTDSPARPTRKPSCSTRPSRTSWPRRPFGATSGRGGP